MAPPQGQQHSNKLKKRPAESSLASSSKKKTKTVEGQVHRESKPGATLQKAGPGKSQQPPNGGIQPSKTGHNGSSTQNNDKQAGGRAFNRKSSLRDVRTIAAQPSDEALNDGELDVQAFLNARGFEIKALDESMRRTRVSNTRQAFQKLPFTMRRRAAAHNHKRIPKRLHKKAKREMEQDNTPTVNSRTREHKKTRAKTRARVRADTALRLGKLAERKRRQKLAKRGQDGKLNEATIQTRIARPKIKRNVPNKPVVTAKKFRKRQLHKTWLPTHLWHAKRAKMTPPKEPLWRFAIPLTPNQKCYRPTHRVLREKGAMAWDMSYMSTISLCGIERSVTQVLKALGLTAESFWNDSGNTWRSGASHWSGTLTRKKEKGSITVGPATVLWDPATQHESSGTDSEKKAMRRLFIRLHPSIFLETFNELLRLAKGLTPHPYVEDLRFEIGSIEVMGPDSTEALLGVLKPYHEKPDTKDPHATKWESLAHVSPSALPAGSLLAFSVMDPRLRYPSRRAQASSTSVAQQTSTSWHKDVTPKPVALFDRDTRFKASRLPSQRAVNRRKGSSPPGALLEPTKSDPEIPVVLLASRQADAPGKWTVLMPWKCVLPVWYTLMHYPLSSGQNPLFGGLREAQQGTFEQGLPWFPGDFPATNAGTAWELEQRISRKRAWDRMPKGKRATYESLDLGAGRKGEIGEGWNCDFEALLGLEAQVTECEKPDVVMEDEGAENVEVSEQQNEDRATPSEQLLARMTHISKLALHAHLPANAEPLPAASLVTVKVKFQGRGVPGPCARIYRLPTSKPVGAATQAEIPATNPPLAKDNGLPSNLREQWLESVPQKGKQTRSKQPVKHNSSLDLDLETRKRLLAQELTAPVGAHKEGIDGHPLCPDTEDLIGFVTTGSFNLKEGQAEGIASLSGEKALAELKRYKNKEDRAARLCIVRNSGQSIGWLARWELA
ncbi:putative Ribonucleases P/MRP protein subunit POP1-domain-containing protein [Seiridium unicorne]|uniref:Ribonucleases P/MRP protein subunit POP1-domain-containing protein n=1 Tax=Seiridium unicorne TaxID=138068 RepID=A0ABR2UPW6_9PEZI